MAAFLMNCPRCRTELEMQDEWAGIQVTCPICQTQIIVPDVSANAGANAGAWMPQTPNAGMAAESFDSVPTPPEEEEDSEGRDWRELCSRWAGPALKILLLLVLLIGGFFVYRWIVTPTPKSLKGNQMSVMTKKRLNRDGVGGVQEIARVDFFPIIRDRPTFFYQWADCISISLQSDGNELYRGTLYFHRNQQKKKTYARPVVVDRTGSFTYYRFPFKYADHPDWLEEDGDLIFALAKQIDKKLEKWEYVSGKASEEEKCVLFCEISKDGKTKTIKLKAEQVECDDKIGRVWVEILSK